MLATIGFALEHKLEPGNLISALAASATLRAIGIGALILAFGFRLLMNLKADSPLNPYAVQMSALIVILPIVLTLALTGKFPTGALTGLLETIVGFFFGGAQHRNAAARQAPPRAKRQQGVQDADSPSQNGQVLHHTLKSWTA